MDFSTFKNSKGLILIHTVIIVTQVTKNNIHDSLKIAWFELTTEYYTSVKQFNTHFCWKLTNVILTYYKICSL